MFLVAEEEASRFCHFNPPLLIISKGHGLKTHTVYHINNSDLGQTAIEQKFENNFFQSVQNALEKKKESNSNLTQRASEGINITKKQSFANLGINIGIGTDIAKFYFSLQEFFLVK